MAGRERARIVSHQNLRLLKESQSAVTLQLEKLQIPSSKNTESLLERVYGAWSLELLGSLVLGIWSFPEAISYWQRPRSELVSGAMSILEELEWRGLIADCTDKARTGQTQPPLRITLYCGFDPTADSLHVGNLVPLLGLAAFPVARPSSDCRSPVARPGPSATPAGKRRSGNCSPRKCSTHNIASVKEQLRRLLDFETATNPARLLDNATWTAPVSFLEFLRDIGKHFSVNQMIAKESVRARMEDRESGHQLHRVQLHAAPGFRFLRAVP